MLTTNPFDDDKLREECGIFGIWAADNAASFVALGLHALQHRGQEAAGIVTFDGKRFHSERRMGLVGDAFGRNAQAARNLFFFPAEPAGVAPPAAEAHSGA